MLEELEQENRLLRSRNERLEAEKKNWVYLTKEDILEVFQSCMSLTIAKPMPQHYEFASKLETKIKEKNT